MLLKMMQYRHVVGRKEFGDSTGPTPLMRHASPGVYQTISPLGTRIMHGDAQGNPRARKKQSGVHPSGYDRDPIGP